mgnify:CR=1 FL=1|tara:strand:- start:886 stop:1860 length:975 start_codon:yes stop_codon:yes gene_type:complete
MKFLVTGGAGYIGSHMVKFLRSKKHYVTIFDNLSTGKKKFVQNYDFVNIDLLDIEKLDRELSKRKFDAVFHFAALSIVDDSQLKPKKYYRNNVIGTKNLVNTMIKYNLNNFIFSSSASVYGNPKGIKIKETHPKIPISNYGKNKLKIEIFLKKIGINKNFKSISFRYFNAAGADPSAKIGEDHKPETHLIPSVLNSIRNKKIYFPIYGNDYDTKDGTCIRDYIHVNDIVKAHYLGLKKFKDKKCILQYNIGTETGYSVLEVLRVIEKVTKFKIRNIIKKRRQGDSPILIANCKKIRKELNWKPKYKNINKIISTAWNWHKKLKH